ncbi:hypothetical protein KAR91_37365 [Candidatus Pacearchaeota archaeon]|nr:hypothetical protein [Candidatus Pacearchaeota archaeon]
MARDILRPIKAIFDGAARAIRGEHNVLVAEVDELKTNYNALLAKLDTNHGAATDHVATLGTTAAESKLVIPR